jgi:hypothetical protein
MPSRGPQGHPHEPVDDDERAGRGARGGATKASGDMTRSELRVPSPLTALSAQSGVAPACPQCDIVMRATVLSSNSGHGPIAANASMPSLPFGPGCAHR